MCCQQEDLASVSLNFPGDTVFIGNATSAAPSNGPAVPPGEWQCLTWVFGVKAVKFGSDIIEFENYIHFPSKLTIIHL